VDERERMKKFISVLVCCVALASMVSIPFALAARPVRTFIWGTMQYKATVVEMNDRGTITFLQTTEDTLWIDDKGGGVTMGSSTLDPCRVNVHWTGETFASDARFRWYTGLHTYEDFTVDGNTGIVVIQTVGKCPGVYPTPWEGTWKIVSSSGDLAGLTGQGTWWGPGASGLGVVSQDIWWKGWMTFKP
jgi:hypothetical protein